MEQLPRLYLTGDEMLKRVARFKDLKGFDGGLPDSNMPGCERMLFNVIGFQPPTGGGGAGAPPVGGHAAGAAALQNSRGFKPGLRQAHTGPRPQGAHPRNHRSLFSV